MSAERETRWYAGLLAAGMIGIAAAGLVFFYWPRPEPERVTVQHLLVSFAGCRTKATRTKGEAERLAIELFARAEMGENFDQLVKKYSDDESYPGIYALHNTGMQPEINEFSRDNMVPAFGDLAFKLRVGQIRIASYDPKRSPYGWHVILRLK